MFYYGFLIISISIVYLNLMIDLGLTNLTRSKLDFD